MSAIYGDRHRKLSRSRALGAQRGAAAVVRRYRFAEGYFTIKELTERLSLSPGVVNRRLRRLLDAGSALSLDALRSGGAGG
jgi:DNA-binding transcriptional ArsR family regulator